MPEFRELRIQLALDHVADILRERSTNLSPASSAYLSYTQDLLRTIGQALRQVNTWTGDDESGAFSFVPNLREVASISSESPPDLDTDQINRVVKVLETTAGQLEELENDPRTFFQDHDCHELAAFFERLSQVYSPDHSPIETDIDRGRWELAVE